MRLGLHSQLRRRWCPRGYKLTQPQQMRFEWKWLSLAVEVQTGKLFWRWQERLRSDCVQETVGKWKEEGIAALVWDNAPSHRAKVVTQVGLPIAYLPPFSPELNPAERIFEEVRRWVEGKLYATLDDKVKAVEHYLQELAQEPERVKKLAAWQWIIDGIQSLESKDTTSTGLNQG